MYYTIVKILTVIKKYLNGWEPTDIFYDENIKYYKYDKPVTGLFWSSSDCSYSDYTYTRLGRWFKDAPDIVSLLKIFWYIPAWTVYIVVNTFWVIIELFLPSSVKEGLL